MLFSVAPAQTHAHFRRGIVIKSFGEHNTGAGQAGKTPQDTLYWLPETCVLLLSALPV